MKILGISCVLGGFLSLGLSLSAQTFTTLHRCDHTDGACPRAEPVQATNGNLYGTTSGGGDYGAFVETQSTSGKVGTAVKILGTDLTGATSVTFNGTAAKFTVVSESEITTSVPTGATTGMVEVTTPKGTVKSNEVFRVTQ
jgi:hypothetical protein